MNQFSISKCIVSDVIPALFNDELSLKFFISSLPVPSGAMNEPDLCFSWRSHIKTFDGRYIYFPGRCTYKLIHDCADNLFSVHVFGDPLCKNLTRCRRSVNLYLGGVDIKVNLVLNFTGSLWGKTYLSHHLYQCNG